MAKPAPRRARARKPERRCYELTGMALSYDDTGRLILIHGTMPEPFRHDHAWVFDPTDNTVFDTTDQRWYPADEYPGIEHHRYTQIEAATLMSLTGNFGSWTDDERAAAAKEIG